MNKHLESLESAVAMLRSGGVATRESRGKCLAVVRRSVQGRHRFWGSVVRPYPVIREYMNEDIAFNLVLVEFMVVLLQRIGALEAASSTTSGTSSHNTTNAAFLYTGSS